MKTRPYDPEIDGDGYSVMVPMHVEPPEGRDCFLWGTPAPGDCIYRKKDGGWFILFPSRDSQLAKALYTHIAKGWTFAPATPEPVKSYAEYLDGDGWFNARGIGGYRPGPFGGFLVGIRMIQSDPKRARALIEFIEDCLLPEGEGNQ